MGSDAFNQIVHAMVHPLPLEEEHAKYAKLGSYLGRFLHSTVWRTSSISRTRSNPFSS